MNVRLEDVWYTYDGVNYVLSSINSEFKGEGLYLIIGPNGAGKTTLLRIIALLYKPSKGRILIDGINPWSSKPSNSLRSDIVYVHDKPIIVRGDVEYNITLGLTLRDLKIVKEAIDYYIDRYNLSEYRKKDARSLSSGNKRIISILRALMLKPKILLIDEPFNHLDLRKTELLIEDLKELSSNSMIIMTSHYLYKEVLEHAREKYEIVAGKMRKL